MLAVPFARSLQGELEHREAGSANLYGFDAGWHGAWRDRQGGVAREFGPEIFGSGFAFRNLDLLLKGALPLGLFSGASGAEGARLDPVILGVGALYLLAQTFLAGGLIGVYRSPSRGFTLRGLLHGAGFYFGRLVRVSLIALALAYVVFRLNAPFARWADHMARESVSEVGALAWAFGRHLMLLLALLLVHLLSSYAKVIVVVEERSSALLAFVSALGLCLRRGGEVLGHALAVAVLFMGALWLYVQVDGLWVTTGYKTQLLALLLMQAFVITRISLRLGFLAGQVSLYGRGGAKLV